MAALTLFEVGVNAHARAARGAIAHVLEEFRARVAVGGVPTPTLDSFAAWAAGEAQPLPDGAREVPPR